MVIVADTFRRDPPWGLGTVISTPHIASSRVLPWCSTGMLISSFPDAWQGHILRGGFRTRPWVGLLCEALDDLPGSSQGRYHTMGVVDTPFFIRTASDTTAASTT